MNSISHVAPTTYSVAQLASENKLFLVGSDFHWSTGLALLVAAFFLWSAKKLFLAKYRIGKKQLQHDRKYSLVVGTRAIAVVKYSPWLRAVMDFIWSVPFSFAIYALISANDLSFRVSGLIVSMAFLLFVVFSIVKTIVHNRSDYYRMKLLFRENPTFLRVRLLFTFLRRLLYLIFGFTFISYALNRIDPGSFIASNGKVDLFLAHLLSTAHGITAGSSYIECNDNLAAVFIFVRDMTTIVCALLFVSIIAAVMSTDAQTNERHRRKLNEISSLLPAEPSESDVFAAVTLVIEYLIGCEGNAIAPQSRLHEDFGTHNLDVIEIIVLLEDLFETRGVSDGEISRISCVGDITLIFWSRIEHERNKSEKPLTTTSKRIQ
jgi:acyl carrier protein